MLKFLYLSSQLQNSIRAKIRAFAKRSARWQNHRILAPKRILQLALFFPLIAFATGSLDTAITDSAEPPPTEVITPTPLPVPAPSYEATFWKMIFALVGIVVFLFIVIFLFKKFFSSKFQGSNALRVIKIVEKRPLSPKTMLYVVEIGKSKVLISESQNEVRRLMNFEIPEEE